jgi:tellurite resistance protein
LVELSQITPIVSKDSCHAVSKAMGSRSRFVHWKSSPEKLGETMSKRLLPHGGGTQLALSPDLAIAAIGLFSTFVDGEATEELETEALGEMLSSIDLYEDYAEEDFQALGAEIASLINNEGINTVVNQAIATAKEKGIEEAAFIVALVIVSADGEVPEEEQEYINHLSEALGLSMERANEIISELFDEEEEEGEEEEV